jgi:hypothetical protein
MVKVKQSCNRPGVSQRVPGGLGSQISWHSAREGGEVVSPTDRPPLPPGMFLVLIFTRGWVDPRAMVWSEGNMSLKNPATPPGIEPGTVRLVAQHLNHYVNPGPKYFIMRVIKWRRSTCAEHVAYVGVMKKAYTIYFEPKKKVLVDVDVSIRKITK